MQASRLILKIPKIQINKKNLLEFKSHFIFQIGLCVLEIGLYIYIYVCKVFNSSRYVNLNRLIFETNSARSKIRKP